MQITPISYNTYNLNQMKSRNISNVSKVNFYGVKQKLIPVNTDSFKTETAKKIYAKIQKYLQLVGREGSIKNVKIINENTTNYESDILLSINKTLNNSKLRLSQKYNGDSSDITLLEANFNKDGQMILGDLPSENLHFERTNPNIRRITDNEYTYLPIGKSDKDWDANGKRIKNIVPVMDYADDGAYEIFMELARLNTSILK